MEPVALAGLVALLLVKEAGLPVPVPGDLLVLGAGVTLAGEGIGAVGVLGLILVAGYVGGSVQFGLMRGVVRRPLLRMLRQVGVPLDRVERLAAWIRGRGWRGVAISRMTPGVRIGSIAASGLAGLPFPTFARGLLVGNSIFVSAHFALGFVLGVSAGRLLDRAATAVVPVAALVVLLAVVGAIGWRVVRRRRRADDASPAAWADAACPACLALVAFDVGGGSRDQRNRSVLM